MSTPARVAILSFSPLAQDARVLRQVEYLAADYTVSLIGYGALDVTWANVTLHTIQPDRTSANRRRVRTLALLPLGRLVPALAYERWYWGRTNHIAALEHLVQSAPQIIHANDWEALPVAVRAAEQTGAQIVLDLHEYAPRQSDDHRHWRLFVKPMIEFFLHKYAKRVAASITVNQTIADLYRPEYGLDPLVVMNAPSYTEQPPFKPVTAAQIHLVHHGVAMRDRKLELMIQAVALADGRYTLSLMLVNSDTAYLAELQALAQQLAPTRIHFLPPVRPTEIVGRIAEFDLGIFLLPPTTFNYAVALPNKFFDFINAGLAVFIGPIPEMARLTQQFGFGIVTNSCAPHVAAAALNRLTIGEIEAMKRSAIEARQQLNGKVEMAKVVNLYARLLAKSPAIATNSHLIHSTSATV